MSGSGKWCYLHSQYAHTCTECAAPPVPKVLVKFTITDRLNDGSMEIEVVRMRGKFDGNDTWITLKNLDGNFFPDEISHIIELLNRAVAAHATISTAAPAEQGVPDAR